jgi:DNA-binding CsgD family transcriptional regulator/tetratricopeptide (TPR) repeat protein
VVNLKGPALIGREEELAVLDAQLGRATRGEFSIVLLLGDPGVGKTRLARELVARHRADTICLSARAHPLGQTTSFGLWAEAFEGHLRSLDPAEVSALCGGFVDDLGALLHSAAAARAQAPVREPPRSRLLEGMAVLVDRLVRRSAVIVVLDDAHVADASSWEALGYLARNLSEAPVLAVVAARSVELSQQSVATQALLSLDQDGFLSRLQLWPLETEALGRLADEALQHEAPAALVAWLAERSLGNPLFALGLLSALQEERADLSAPRLEHLPEALVERVAGRARALEEPTRTTLDVLAALGRRVDLDELVGLSGLPLERLGESLERLVGTGLVREEERGRELTYELAHPLVQEAVYQGTGGARRRSIHRRLGRALLAAGRVGEAAPHFARSAAVGDGEAIAAVCEALRQAEDRGAYREALGILGVIVEIVPSGDRRWLEVLDAMAWQPEWVLDHRGDVHAVLGVRAMRAIDTVLEGSPDPVRQAAVKLRLASFLSHGMGELDEGERCCDAAVELFAAGDDRRGALLAAVERAYGHMLRGEFATAETRMRTVMGVAEATGDRFVLLQALIGIGWNTTYMGRFDDADQVWGHALDLARTDENRYRIPFILMAMATLRAMEGRIDEAGPLVAEAKSAGQAWRDGIPEEEVLVHWLAGDLSVAVTTTADWIDWNVDGMSLRRVEFMGLAVLAAVETRRIAEARRFLGVAEKAHQGRDWIALLDLSRYGEAVLVWHEGRRAEALALLRIGVSRLLEKRLLPFAAFACLDLAELAAEEVRADLAGEAAALLGEVADQLGRDLYRALAQLAHAAAGLASGGPHRAAGPARAAAGLFGATRYPVMCARALDVLGRSLVGHDRAGAVEAFEKAAELFDRCGAVLRRDRTLDALRRLGGRGQRAAAALLGAPSLTPRERQVARLAAQGHTLRQIGTRLYIGERTVETHLARSYAKLGVKSKSELVERATELGL